MKKVIIFCVVIVILSASAYSKETAIKNAPKNVWSTEKAWQWYWEVSPIRGCNYLPRTAVNMTEMWQADTFDPETIDEELGWAEKAGYNNVRIFLQYLVWKELPQTRKTAFGGPKDARLLLGCPAEALATLHQKACWRSRELRRARYKHHRHTSLQSR